MTGIIVDLVWFTVGIYHFTCAKHFPDDTTQQLLLVYRVCSEL